MARFPSPQQLVQWSDTLGTIDTDTAEQAHALEQARRLMRSLAKSPEVTQQLAAGLTAACEVLSQGARERMIAVIGGRLREVNSQAMDRFEQGRANPALLRSYRAFAEATRQALAMRPLDPLDAPGSRETHSTARIEAFNAAEATVSGVRAALKQPLGRLGARSELRKVARDYQDSDASVQAFIEHLGAALAATGQAATVDEAPAVRRKGPGRR